MCFDARRAVSRTKYNRCLSRSLEATYEAGRRLNERVLTRSRRSRSRVTVRVSDRDTARREVCGGGGKGESIQRSRAKKMFDLLRSVACSDLTEEMKGLLPAPNVRCAFGDGGVVLGRGVRGPRRRRRACVSRDVHVPSAPWPPAVDGVVADEKIPDTGHTKRPPLAARDPGVPCLGRHTVRVRPVQCLQPNLGRRVRHFEARDVGHTWNSRPFVFSVASPGRRDDRGFGTNVRAGQKHVLLRSARYFGRDVRRNRTTAAAARQRLHEKVPKV